MPSGNRYHRHFATAMVVLQFVCASATFAAEAVEFSLGASTQATVQIQDGYVHYQLQSATGTRSANIPTQTEQPVHLETADYDFSGRQGFAFWSIDEGQGVYKVYRVFTFSRKRNDFIERSPRCGDAFLNLRVDPRRKQLISTFFENNVPKSCITRLPLD